MVFQHHLPAGVPRGTIPGREVRFLGTTVRGRAVDLRSVDVPPWGTAFGLVHSANGQSQVGPASLRCHRAYTLRAVLCGLCGETVADGVRARHFPGRLLE